MHLVLLARSSADSVGSFGALNSQIGPSNTFSSELSTREDSADWNGLTLRILL